MSLITAAFLGVAHVHTPDFVRRLNLRSEQGEVTVKSVYDAESIRGNKRADELKASFVDSPDAILNDPEINAVVVCAETYLHKDLVIWSAEAGKHIFCEKPLGLGADDAGAMAQAIEQAGVTFQTGYFQRSSPANQFIKQEVEAGHLGKVTRANFNNCHGAVIGGWFDTDWRWLADAKLAGGGALLDMGAHPLDLTISTFSKTEGAIVSAVASLGNRNGRYGNEIDEYGSAIVTFESGFAASFAASWLDPGPLRAPTSVFGTGGQIVVRDGSVFYQSQHVSGMDGKEPVAALPEAAPHAFELFWDDLLGKPIQVPLVSVREAALGATVMEKLYHSAGRSTTTGL